MRYLILSTILKMIIFGTIVTQNKQYSTLSGTISISMIKITTYVYFLKIKPGVTLSLNKFCLNKQKQKGQGSHIDIFHFDFNF